MSGWALAVLVVMAVPIVWAVGLIVSDARHNRRVRSDPDSPPAPWPDSDPDTKSPPA